MSLLNIITSQLIDVIEWTDDSRDTLSYRWPDEDKEIKNGAQLIVRESQLVQFVAAGQYADLFKPGKHTLTTENIPILSTILGWKYGFQSPFKCDVYFLNTRLFTGNKWGTANPVMMRDKDFGVVRLRAFGTYDFRIVEASKFLREVAGTDQNFRLDEFADTMRSRMVSVFTEALARAGVPVLEVAQRYAELGEALLLIINPAMRDKYGLEVTSFVLENVSVPPEVEQAIDKRSSMTVIGNLNEYVKYQMGVAMGQGGEAGAAATMPAQMAMGFGMAQEMMRSMQQGGAQHAGTQQFGAHPGSQQSGAPHPAMQHIGTQQPPGVQASGVNTPGAAGAAPALEVLTPEQAAQVLGVAVADVMAAISAGELKARRIGSAHRIARGALEEFLRG